MLRWEPNQNNDTVRRGANVIISWPGVADTRLQKSSSLTTPNWQDVVGSLGASSATGLPAPRRIIVWSGLTKAAALSKPVTWTPLTSGASLRATEDGVDGSSEYGFDGLWQVSKWIGHSPFNLSP
jgi:hypothetical protein